MNQLQHDNKSNAYQKIVLPRFGKSIEITKNSRSSKINLLDVKVYNSYSKDCIRSLLLEERDLLQIIPDPTVILSFLHAVSVEQFVLLE